VIGVLASDIHGQVDGAARWKPPPLLAAPWWKPSPLLAAPGISIMTTVPPSNYNEVRGSSLAAAHVTGVAALLLEREPHLSPRRVRDILHATARPTKASGGRPQPSTGIVDACAALEKLLRQRLCP